MSSARPTPNANARRHSGPPPASAPGFDAEERTPLTDLLRKRLKDKVEVTAKDGSKKTMTAAAAIVDTVIELAVSGDKWGINFVYTRTEGEPVRNIEIGGQVPQSLAQLIQFGLKGTGIASPLPEGQEDGASGYNDPDYYPPDPGEDEHTAPMPESKAPPKQQPRRQNIPRVKSKADLLKDVADVEIDKKPAAKPKPAVKKR